MKKTPSDGWILYHRESRNHHLRSNPLVWNYWVHCLEEAAWKDHNVYWNGREFMLKRGSFITSIAKEMAKLGCTRSNLRTARKVLESCTMINLSSSRAGTLIEVTNFNDWQDWEKIRNQGTDQQLTKQPPSSHQRLTNSSPQQNKGNKLNKEKKKILKARARMKI